MKNGRDKALVAVLVVLFGGPLLAYALYRLYLYLHRQILQRKRVSSSSASLSHSLKKEDRQAAFSVGGNLVLEFSNLPITDVYQFSKSPSALLGRGSSAEVVVAEHVKNRRRYAIKIIDNTRTDVMWRYDREKNFLRDIDHTNVVRLYEVYSYKQSMFFVMELCTGGHLGQALQHVPKNAFPEETARNYVLQILRALVHCHDRGICHRDIKLQNILMENHSRDAQVKVIDFGNAVRYRGQIPLTKVVGTTYTAAPEVFRKHYDERCDVWSLGVVAYILLSGRRPFERVEIAQNAKSKESSVIASILMGRYHFKHEIWQTISTDGIGFVKACLEMDFTRRAFPVDLLNHPWMVINRGSKMHTSFARNTMLNLTTAISSPTSHSRLPSDSSIALEGQLSSPNMLNRDTGSSLLNTGAIDNSSVGYSSKSSISNRQPQPFQTGIRQTSMLAVAFAMPISRARQLRDLFQQMDRNNNGTIDREEFRSAFQQFHPELSTNDSDLLFDVIDQDNNHAISFLEFVAATIDPREVDIREMNQAFRILDKDQKGYLTKADLLRVLSTVPPEEQVPPSPHARLSRQPSQQWSSQRTSSRHNSNRSASQPIPAVSHLSSGSKLVGVEKGENQEAERLQRINEKVDHILNISDINKDGVISYTEFIFSMAEGSMALFDGVDVNPAKLAQAPAVSQGKSFISRLGMGNRSFIEAQTLMRQLSSKRANITSPSIEKVPSKWSFVSSLFNNRGGGPTSKYSEQSGSDGLQPVESLEDSYSNETDKGRGNVVPEVPSFLRKSIDEGGGSVEVGNSDDGLRSTSIDSREQMAKKMFLQKQGTFANICIEDNDWQHGERAPYNNNTALDPQQDVLSVPTINNSSRDSSARTSVVRLYNQSNSEDDEDHHEYAMKLSSPLSRRGSSSCGLSGAKVISLATELDVVQEGEGSRSMLDEHFSILSDHRLVTQDF